MQQRLTVDAPVTHIYFVRHALPDYSWLDDRHMPLTTEGEADALKVMHVLKDVNFDFCISSPYKRTRQTIAPVVRESNLIVHVDERLKERVRGILGNSGTELQIRRWNNFDFHEKDGESMTSLQQRNMAALLEVLNYHSGENILFSTHGAALSAILNFYDPSFTYKDFKRIEKFTPYILRLTFDNANQIVAKKELLIIDKSRN
ncbi:histidine phosphatase family protein [Leuconostoc rapi]|uniref:histidine phosphatase family protein n=1 Tax=Leuconostoc rapi TaxID=1406906 RepID=UPI001957371A|nr:histidine phosphatase family protein [Leuconostoc rapi]MBM7435078.1 2,3-bisphosphoglycerate-dependent phosphoglycerate mutase [Leuconostoc rapi]